MCVWMPAWRVRLEHARHVWASELRAQSVSQLFHGPAPRSPLHRLAVRLRHSRSNTSTESSLPGGSTSSLYSAIGPILPQCSVLRDNCAVCFHYLISARANTTHSPCS